MRLFEVVLFCGALLGVVSADSTTRLGETDFRSRIHKNDLGVNPQVASLQLRATYFDADNRNKPATFSCGSTSFLPSYDGNRKAYHIKTKNPREDLEGFITFTVNSDATYAQGSSAETSVLTNDGFEHEGRYKMCGCIPTNAKVCETSFDASSTSYDIDFGWLHVVDSVALVGPHALVNNMYTAFEPKVPSVILQASVPGGAVPASVQASWLMNSVTPISSDADRFMVIDTSSRKLDASALGGWQCGNTHWDGNSSDAEITVLANSLITSTDVSGCATSIFASAAGVNGEDCTNKVLRESAPFQAPEVNSTSFSNGFLCFCDYSNNGQCSTPADFGAALGPIVFRQFYVSNQEKHYTVLSAPKQLIQIAARSDVNFTVADALGLVRQDDSSSSNSYSYTYSHNRGCGWSNLDIEPTLGKDADTAEYQFSQFDVATDALVAAPDTREVAQAVYRLDFSGVHTRRYELCMCQTSFMSFDSFGPAVAIDNRLAGAHSFITGCPKPAVPNSGGDVTLHTNDNYRNSFFNLFYAQSAGTLHVVNLLSLDVNVMLQTSTYSHLSVNLMSRKKSPVRDADHVFYQNKLTALQASRFYITEGVCGTGAAYESGTLALLGNLDMYARVKDAYFGVVNQGTQTFARDSIFEETGTITWDGSNSAKPADNQRWSALWSLTTGWDADTFKPLGGAGAEGSNGPSQRHSRSAGQPLYPTTVTPKEAPLNLCFCDQTTEFPSSSIDTCSTQARAGDYSNFKVQVGNVQIAKFVFNNGKPKHYTVFKATAQSFSMAVPAGGASTDPENVSNKDKLMIIPAYGDGYGVDNAKPAVKVDNVAVHFSDPSSSKTTLSNKPWKTVYTCGQDHSGTRRTFNFEDSWVTIDAQNEIGIATASSTLVETSPVSFAAIPALKYKICYCSSSLGACPSGKNFGLSDATSSTGFISANRYSDFAGYLHIVYQSTPDSLPLFTVTHPDYWKETFNDYGNRSVVLSDFSTVNADSKVGFLFVENLATLCGAVQAFGAGSTLIPATPTTNSGDDFPAGVIPPNPKEDFTNSATDILGPVYTNSPRDLQLQICLCDPRSERLAEYVKGVTSGPNEFNTDMAKCNPSSFNQFGASIGVLSIAEFVVPFGSIRHFTITGQSTDQTFDIVNIVPAAVVTTTASSGNASMADHVGFLEMQKGVNTASTAKSCGTDALDDHRLVAIASKSSTTLTTSPYNYRLKGFMPQELVKVCYCQVALFDGEMCKSSNAKVWADLGFLHMVDMAVWPQSFIMRSGWSTAEATQIANSYSVTFSRGATKPGDGSAWAISGANINSATAAVGTYRCGATSEYTGATPLTSSQYTDMFPGAVAFNFQDNKLTVTDFDTSKSKIAYQPDGPQAGQTLGVNNFKYVCMCDTNEIRPSGSESDLVNQRCTDIDKTVTSAAEWSNFGVTVGKVYFAKTVTLAGTSGSTYRPEFRAHFTLSRATDGSQSFTMQGVSVATDKQDLVHSMDMIGFLDATTSPPQNCGIDLPFLISAVTPLTTQAGAFTGAVDAKALAFKGDFQPKQASKFLICLCRNQVLGSCADEGSFFETVGWMHIVNLVPDMFGATFPKTSNTDVTISLDFADLLYNPFLDRFALIVNEGKCGQFSSIIAPLGQSPKYAADFGNGKAGFQYEVAVQYDAASQTQLLLSNSMPDYTTTQYKTATLRFAGKATFSLCYCAFDVEGTCGTQVAASPTEQDLLTFYSRFGATLGTVKIMSFLTDIDDEAFTIYASQALGGSQIGISKTSTGLVTVDYGNDRWALVSSTDSCGLATAPLLTFGLFTDSAASAAYRDQGRVDACVVPEEGIARSDYECGTTDGKVILTESNQDKFDNLAPGKYKLCLCSAGGTASILGTCNVTSSFGSADFGDQAGYVHVLAGNATVYGDQTVMVDANDASATVSFDFGPEQALSATDRFALVDASFRCGDARTPAENQVYSSTTFDDVTYTVAGNTLTTGPLGFSSPGVYKVCYCSTASEGACPDSQTDGLASYGAELGMLIVSDYQFGEVSSATSNTWTVEEKKSATLKLFYASDFVRCRCTEAECTTKVSFVPDNLPCSTTVADGATTAVDLPDNSGDDITVDFTSIAGSRSFYRACFSTTSGTRSLDFNRLGVWVSDVAVSPSTTQQALTPVTLTYTNSLAEKDLFWFRHSDIPCQGALSTATPNSTAAHKVPASGVAVSDVDFRQMSPSDDYRLCVGTDCDGTACNGYLDYRGVNAHMSVFSRLTVSPKAVPAGATAVNITIVYDASVLAGYSAWFQYQDRSCTYPSDSSITSTDAVPLAADPLTFNTVSTEASPTALKLCAATSALAPALDFGPVGILIMNLKVAPQVVNQGLNKITLSGPKNNATHSREYFKGDQVYFLDTNIPCSAVSPTVATATSTQAATITAAGCSNSAPDCTTTLQFDFSLMSGESRLCILPVNSVDTVLDVDVDVDTNLLQPRITVLDIFLSRTSVRSAVGQPIKITYGKETLSGSGVVWFERTCSKDPDTASTSAASSSSVVPLSASGKVMSFDFDNTDASQTILNLCFRAAGATITRSLTSVGVYVTKLTVSPRSVVREATELTLVDGSSELVNGDTLMFRQSSISCASSMPPASTFSPSHNYQSQSTFTLDFTSTAVSASPYRLCLTTAAGAIIDLDIVELFVIDALVRPNVVQPKIDTSVVFSNTQQTGIANEASLAAGDVVWFVQQGHVCSTSAPAAGDIKNTNAVQMIAGQDQTYLFDFSLPSSYDKSTSNPLLPFFLCVLRGAETRSYESITIRVSMNELAAANTLVAKKGDYMAPVTVTNPGIQKLMSETDFVAFVAVTSACDYTESSESLAQTSGGIDRTNWLQFGDIDDIDKMKVDVIGNLNIPLRLCAFSQSLQEGFDLAWVKLSIFSISLEATSNPAYTIQASTVRFKVQSGLKTGDNVLLASDCSTETKAATDTVESVINEIAQVTFDLSSFTPGLNYDLCVVPPNQPINSNVLVGAGIELFVTGGYPSGKSRLVRISGTTLDNNMVTAADTSATNFANDALTGATGQYIMSGSCDSSASSALVDPFDRINELLPICRSFPPTHVEFGNIGVVVSDISIMGSSMADTLSVGSVSDAPGQTVTFKTRKPFPSTSKLFFQDSTVPCGDTSALKRSSTVPMPFLATTADTWSMEFNFTGTKVGTTIYRLCVESAPDSPILDFTPLGVRVTDTVIKAVVAGEERSNSVQPSTNQNIKITTTLQGGTDSRVRFVTVDSTECPATDTENTTSAVVLPDPATSIAVDFSNFAGKAEARLCYTSDIDATPVEWHMFSSVVVKFGDVTISPASVPANDGQLVKLTYPGASLVAGNTVLFHHPTATCNVAAFSSDSTSYSSSATVTLSGDVLTFDFTGMYSVQDFDAKLCVRTSSTTVLSLPVTIKVSKPVVGIAGDPHVRSASGAWLDFYGEAGVYELLNGGIQANARFGYAVRDNFMIWHPKVMRPGTLVEEVGVQLKDTQTSLRLGIQGGGIVSIRQGLKSTDFWAGTEERAMEIGDYSISWSMCEQSCEVVLPWGTHQRSKTLTIEGRGEFMQLHISKSGGYRFIDVEAIPSSSSTGLLADAASAPAELATHLLSGGEAMYSASVAMLKA